jgi:hypothetical protein
MVKEKGEYTFIDKVKVRLLAREDKYWAELVNLSDNRIHIPDRFVKDYERLLEGGIWAQVDITYRYDEELRSKGSPFWITKLNPIQVASYNHDKFKAGRAEFTTDEWLDLLIRSVGLEPSEMERRLKLLLIARLIPLVETNFNLVELGPRGTGKSFVYRETTPYAHLLSGGKTTVANMFYNMNTRKVGLVGLWDVVAFDEVGGMDLRDGYIVDIMKDYLESGSFSRGREEITAKASVCLLGNINQPIDVLVKSSHLFQPFPENVKSQSRSPPPSRKKRGGDRKLGVEIRFPLKPKRLSSVLFDKITSSEGENQMEQTENRVEKKRVTVREYADMMDIGVTTVYRYIKGGKLETEKLDGVSLVVIDENHTEMPQDDKENPFHRENHRLQDENQWLREQVSNLTAQLQDSSHRHDTIVLQMTQQLDKAHLQIEDLRKQRGAGGKRFERFSRIKPPNCHPFDTRFHPHCRCDCELSHFTLPGVCFQSGH